MNSALIDSLSDTGLQDFIGISKYARYDKSLGRRETWSEATSRVDGMHAARYGEKDLAGISEDLIRAGVISPSAVERSGLAFSLSEARSRAFGAVDRKEVLPSMRSLQFGGLAIESNEARIYNCAFSHCDRVEFFAEALYLLLCGVGVGYSVQAHHVGRLPIFRSPRRHDAVAFHRVADTIEGWADALGFLVRSRMSGRKAKFDFSLIRPEGSPLKTSGGKAPGPEPLRRALLAVDKVLALISRDGRRMRPIEAYDVICHSAKAVLSGGIRRSATICLFSIFDEEMMKAKTGNWWKTNPQRSASNNSAVIVRGKATRKQFDRLFAAQREFGEPGFFFTDSEEYGANPCVEIGMHPRLKVTEESAAMLRAYGYAKSFKVGDVLSGFQFCNLTTTNGAKAITPKAFYAMCRDAALIGTLQAGYTNFKYLSPVSRIITENEALLGVSICGILDNPDVLLTPEVLEKGAEVVRTVNQIVARAIGIKPAARSTCVKPEGTASLVFRSGSGIHPQHDHRYFQRVQVNVNDPIYQFLKKHNPQMSEASVYDPHGKTDVITFCVEANPRAMVRKDLTAAKHLSLVSLVQKHWVKSGKQSDEFMPGGDHNVSNTITVSEGEWEYVADFIWNNRGLFTGVSLLASDGEKAYAQAPRESVTTAEDLETWNRLRSLYTPVDYTKLLEKTDATKLKEIVACAGGACALV